MQVNDHRGSQRQRGARDRWRHLAAHHRSDRLSGPTAALTPVHDLLMARRDSISLPCHHHMKAFAPSLTRSWSAITSRDGGKGTLTREEAVERIHRLGFTRGDVPCGGSTRSPGAHERTQLRSRRRRGVAIAKPTLRAADDGTNMCPRTKRFSRGHCGGRIVRDRTVRTSSAHHEDEVFP
jgi:hypothetical protein